METALPINRSENSQSNAGSIVKTILKVVQLVFLGTTFALAPSELAAQGLTVVPVGIAGLNNNTIHSYVSRDTGLFRKYGIDARLVVFQAGSLLAQASMAGEVKISMVAGPVTIASRAAGSDSIIIGALINTLPYKMVVAKGITRSDQLKGKRIGISRFGSSTDTAVRLFLAKFALNADKDVVLVQAGEQANRFAALAGGTIDATIVGVPLDITAQKQGFPVLADLAANKLSQAGGDECNPPSRVQSS
jgi:NitT/TauT family transport system substrate-binding protein